MLGKKICDLAPTPENRRNSEGAFITLKDGKILFVYSRFSNQDWADDAEADLYGMLSEDNGETFGEPYPIFSHTRLNANNLMSVSLLRMQNGDIGLFFGVKIDNFPCIRYVMARSSDEGKTWADPIVCVPPSAYHVVHNDRVIRCDNGTILIPAGQHIHGYATDSEGNLVNTYTPGALTIYASYDDGYTWSCIAEEIPIPTSRGLHTGVHEPGLVQLDSNTLWCFIRTDAGVQYETFSHDCGKTWCQPLPSPFTSPEAPMSAKRLSDGRIIAIWNPIPLYNGRQVVDGIWTWARTPLVLAVSTDNGNTFSDPIPIEIDPNRGFCYTAIHETPDGAVLLAYCAGASEEVCCLNRLRIRKISLRAF